ncbi:alpha/beta fold hydrolase [Rubrolithibacter danxiaensis]|uniref:alpha/beta fold hydrolase n=1 Tax=Rubrolithibacter danxiaensis TaxID=3390805 RepID=UPI003BF9250D
MKAYTGDSITYSLSKISVSENRLSATSRSIQLSLLKLKAKAQNPSFPILFLAGGPGQSGINYIKEDYFQKLIFQLQQDHDIILLDQRGSGSSLPSLIYKVPLSDKKDIFLSKDKIIQVSDLISKAGADTFKVRNIDIRGYNTIQNADDLNDIRIALGVPKINLLAVSYGTHLALAAARKYPDFINQMVLIGTSGLNDMHHLPFAYDAQLQKISDLAAQDTAINKQVPNMIALLKKVLAKLEKEPVHVQIKDKKADEMIDIAVGKFGLQMILRLDAGDSYDFIYFPALLHGIDKGNYSLLQEYVEKRYNQFNSDYSSGIGVMRTASGATKERYAVIEEQGKTALLGNSMNTPDIYTKNYFGDIDLGDNFRKSFSSSISTLFISGTMDSNTPPSNAVEVKKSFTNAEHLLVEYASHEDMLPDESVQKEIVEFYKKNQVDHIHLSLPKPKFEAPFK